MGSPETNSGLRSGIAKCPRDVDGEFHAGSSPAVASNDKHGVASVGTPSLHNVAANRRRSSSSDSYDVSEYTRTSAQFRSPDDASRKCSYKNRTVVDATSERLDAVAPSRRSCKLNWTASAEENRSIS